MVNIKMDTSYHENSDNNRGEIIVYFLRKIIQINTLIRSNYLRCKYCFSEKYGIQILSEIKDFIISIKESNDYSNLNHNLIKILSQEV